MDEAAIANIGIGRKFQKPTVFENHTVWDNLELAMKAKRTALASLRWKLSSAQQNQIDATLKRINLDDRRAAAGRRVVPRAEAMARNWNAADAGAGIASGR